MKVYSKMVFPSEASRLLRCNCNIFTLNKDKEVIKHADTKYCYTEHIRYEQYSYRHEYYNAKDGSGNKYLESVEKYTPQIYHNLINDCRLLNTKVVVVFIPASYVLCKYIGCYHVTLVVSLFGIDFGIYPDNEAMFWLTNNINRLESYYPTNLDRLIDKEHTPSKAECTYGITTSGKIINPWPVFIKCTEDI